MPSQLGLSVITDPKKSSFVSNRVGGILTGDVDVSGLDINQCDLDLDEKVGQPASTNQIRGFAASHKCHQETSKVSLNF